MARPGDDDPTADLLIREVDDDIRRDQYVALWRRYGLQAIAVCVLIVIAVGGWEGWKEWRASQQRNDAQRYAAAEQLAVQGKTKDAEAALAKLAAEGSTGYRYAAATQEAALLLTSGDAKGAEAAFDTLAKTEKDPTLRDLAVLKSALAAVESGGDPAPVQARVAAIAASGNPWYYEAVEIQALIALKTGDTRHATDLLKQIADDSQAPQGVRARAAQLLAAAPPDAAAVPHAVAAPPGASGPTQAAVPPAAGGLH